MATHTMYFHEAIEVEPGIITKALTEYPIFNEEYRDHLNKTITDNFWNQEIGQETASMFEFALRRKMNLIMPLYNEHYKTSLWAAGVDPLQTMSITNTGKNTGKSTGTVNGKSNGKTTGVSAGKTVSDTETVGDSTSESASNAVSRAVASEFPQSVLKDDGDYATNAQDNISKTTSTGKAAEKTNTAQETLQDNTQQSIQEDSQESTQEELQEGETEGKVVGSQGQTSMLLYQHRQTLVNVDLMVLNELNELFMSVWSNGDEMLSSNRMGMGNFGYYGHAGIW